MLNALICQPFFTIQTRLIKISLTACRFHSSCLLAANFLLSHPTCSHTILLNTCHPDPCCTDFADFTEPFVSKQLVKLYPDRSDFCESIWVLCKIWRHTIFPQNLQQFLVTKPILAFMQATAMKHETAMIHKTTVQLFLEFILIFSIPNKLTVERPPEMNSQVTILQHPSCVSCCVSPFLFCWSLPVEKCWPPLITPQINSLCVLRAIKHHWHQRKRAQFSLLYCSTSAQSAHLKGQIISTRATDNLLHNRISILFPAGTYEIKLPTTDYIRLLH
jgi:hypothetical protein